MLACSSSSSSSAGSDEGDLHRFCSSFVAHYAQLSGRGVGVDVPILRSGFADLGATLDELQQTAPTQVKG